MIYYELIAFNGRTIAYRDIFRNQGNAIEEANNLSKTFDRVIVNRMSNGITVYLVEKEKT